MKRVPYESVEIIGSVVIVALMATVYFLSKSHASAEIQLAADFAAAAAVGVVALYIRHANIMQAIESNEVRYKELLTQIMLAIQADEERDKQLLAVVSEHLKRADRNLEILKHATHSVDVEDATKVWLWNLTAVRDRYCATNYHCKADYTTMNEARLDMQRALMAGFDVTIDKVFIVDSYDEVRAEWVEILEAEAEAGIDVRIILKEKLYTQNELKKDAERLRIDFDIFDDRIVMWWECDDVRCTRAASLLMRESDVETYNDFFDNLFHFATEWKTWKKIHHGGREQAAVSAPGANATQPAPSTIAITASESASTVKPPVVIEPGS